MALHNHARRKELPHLLQTVEILTEIGLEVVGHDLLELARLHVLLSVEEPLGDVVLKRVADDGNELINLLVGQLTSTTALAKQNRRITACEYRPQPSCTQRWRNDDQYP